MTVLCWIFLALLGIVSAQDSRPITTAVQFFPPQRVNAARPPQSQRPTFQDQNIRFVPNQQQPARFDSRPQPGQPGQPGQFVQVSQPQSQPRPFPPTNNPATFSQFQPQRVQPQRVQPQRVQPQRVSQQQTFPIVQSQPTGFRPSRPLPVQVQRQPANPQFRPAQQQQQFRPQSQQQFRPQTQQQQQSFRPVPNQVPQEQKKKKKQEVDPATLNKPTEDNPSPTNAQGRRFVAQPELEKCRTRKITSRFGNKGYYESWEDPQHASKEYDWLDARNFCRQRCMDSVSIETAEENRFVQELFLKGWQSGKVEHVWTSGRVCDFDGCDRKDLQPVRVNGWFWPATGGSAAHPSKTDKFSGWSKVGGNPGQGQPDNRQNDENCIAILHPNVYNEPDGRPHWHDVKCTFRKMLCEDNENLLGFTRQENPGVSVP